MSKPRTISVTIPVSKVASILEAIDTAMDDSYEWSKYSDPDDDRREHEGDALAFLHSRIEQASRKAGL